RSQVGLNSRENLTVLLRAIRDRLYSKMDRCSIFAQDSRAECLAHRRVVLSHSKSEPLYSSLLAHRHSDLRMLLSFTMEVSFDTWSRVHIHSMDARMRMLNLPCRTRL